MLFFAEKHFTLAMLHEVTEIVRNTGGGWDLLVLPPTLRNKYIGMSARSRTRSEKAITLPDVWSTREVVCDPTLPSNLALLVVFEGKERVATAVIAIGTNNVQGQDHWVRGGFGKQRDLEFGSPNS